MKFLNWEMETWLDGDPTESRPEYCERIYQLERRPWLFVAIAGHESRPDNWRGRLDMFNQKVTRDRAGTIEAVCEMLEQDAIRVRDEFMGIGASR